MSGEKFTFPRFIMSIVEGLIAKWS